MFVSPSDQLRYLVFCFLSGGVFGISADFIRVLRNRVFGKVAGAVCETIFAAAYFCCLFLIGFTANGGAQRLYAPFFSLLGAVLYFISVSPLFVKFFSKATELISKILRPVLFPFKFLIKILKKFRIFLKNRFKKQKKCYKIKCRRQIASEGSTMDTPLLKGTVYEAEKGRYNY